MQGRPSKYSVQVQYRGEELYVKSVLKYTQQAQAKHLVKAAPAKTPLHLSAYATGHNAGRRTADQSAKPDDQRTDPLGNGWVKPGPQDAQVLAL